jgi:hypothetical protein
VKSGSAGPSGEEKFDHIEYQACPACGLKQSVGSMQDGKCVRCMQPMTPRKESAPAAAAESKPEPGPSVEGLRKALNASGYDLSPAEVASLEPGQRNALAEWFGGKVIEKPEMLVALDSEAARLKAQQGVAEPAPKSVDPRLVPGPAKGLPKSHLLATLETTCEVAPETVRYEWGEEAIQLAQYCTVRVGPFASTTNVREGESREAALERLGASVTAFADAERARKVRSFLVALKGAREEARKVE